MNIGNRNKALLHGKELLIFDFDGTIADTSKLHAEAFRDVLSSLAVNVDYSMIAGLKTIDAIRLMFKHSQLPLSDSEAEQLTLDKQMRVRMLISQSIEPLPGVDAFLCWARPHFKLAMVSSGSRKSVELALSLLGYSGWFNPLICADDVINAKPDPEGFLVALRVTGVSADKALVFEDSKAGILAAEKALLDYVDVTDLDWDTLKLES